MPITNNNNHHLIECQSYVVHSVYMRQKHPNNFVRWDIIIPILERRKLRLRERRWHAKAAQLLAAECKARLSCSTACVLPLPLNTKWALKIVSKTFRFTGASSSTAVTAAKMAVTEQRESQPGSLAPEPPTFNHNSFLQHKDICKILFWWVPWSVLHSWNYSKNSTVMSM